MKVILMFFLCLLSNSSYSADTLKKINFSEASIDIPVKWNADKKNNCLFVTDGRKNISNYLTVCRSLDNGESDYFRMNEDGDWEAITEGVPVLADMNVTSKFTGMSAIISCKHKDDAGYHSEQCFQAEIDLPSHIRFIFAGQGDVSLFKYYKEVYLSFKVKK
ncbi:TPA: hypothetical protein ACPEY2_004193 [Citrobacter amalonaticus]